MNRFPVAIRIISPKHDKIVKNSDYLPVHCDPKFGPKINLKTHFAEITIFYTGCQSTMHQKSRNAPPPIILMVFRLAE